MAEKSVKEQTLSGAIWKFSERVLGQVVSFIVSIVLARILMPDDYGVIALVVVFTTLCDKLIICGFATSLIQKSDADDLDFSSVFLFSGVAAIILYAVLFFSAPFIADFFEKFDRELLISIIRVYGLSLFIIAYSSVQHAYVSKNMLFRRNFWSALCGTILSGTIGILMAYKGYGVWALVAQGLLFSVVDSAVLLITVKWYPKLAFSLSRLKALFDYGWKIFLASIIKLVYNDLRSLVIGKFFTPADLAYYNRGQTLPQLVDNNISGTIDSVLFPAYSKLQENKSSLLSAMRRAVKTSSYVLMPSLALMAAVASPLVSILLTDKWLPCVPFMQILCFSFMLSPVEIENLQSIKAIGRSDLVLKLEVIKRIIGVLLLIASVKFGVIAIAWSMLIGNIIAAVINAAPNKKLISYSIRYQIFDILPSLIMSLVVFISVQGLLLFIPREYPWLQLLGGGLFGLCLYISMSILGKNESFRYILSYLKGAVKTRR